MLSILIPIYNNDSSQLVDDLAKLGRELRSVYEGFDFEIILADDASTDAPCIVANKSVAEKNGCRYLALSDNIGRARIRNLLADEARFDYLLFIDCDAAVAATDFLAHYWQERDKGDVVCGSLRNPDEPPQSGHELRYRYERQADKRRKASTRALQPYRNFTTFNVLFHKRVFEKVRFDERCTQYGYEDSLMGLMLKERGFSIAHIDNPLIHLGIDSNKSYLDKTETALGVLKTLDEPLQSHVAASRVYKRLRRWYLDSFFGWLFKMFQHPLRRHLLGRHPRIILFQIYKIGYYIRLNVDA